MAQTIRQSVWIYPLANILHIVSLTAFAGAIAVMDLRMLGAFSATAPAGVIVPAQRIAVLTLLIQMVTGLVLFTAEASHVALNAVFQTKAALIVLALTNALLIQQRLSAALAKTSAACTAATTRARVCSRFADDLDCSGGLRPRYRVLLISHSTGFPAERAPTVAQRQPSVANP